jgi:rod shape-determining protein MreC
MEYSPPPLFKQGASARAKVTIFSLLAIGLLIVDSRFHALGTIRTVIGTALYPLQRTALVPRDAYRGVTEYFASLRKLEQENLDLKMKSVTNAQSLQQNQQLAAENAQLRKLLGASERLPAKSLMAEVLYDARDPFTRKIVLDRGSRHGVMPGQPVIDDAGVVGQVTRVLPLTSEVTLLTDKDQAIPVQVVRSGLRSVAYGRGSVGLELRFMATNADIRKGDALVTSGLDGIYPPGLAVAHVSQVETKSTDAFAHIVCQPAAGIDRNRQLLILLTEPAPPRPLSEETRDKKPAKRQSMALSDTGKEANKEQPGAAQAKPTATTQAQSTTTHGATTTTRLNTTTTLSATHAQRTVAPPAATPVTPAKPEPSRTATRTGQTPAEPRAATTTTDTKPQSLP